MPYQALQSFGFDLIRAQSGFGWHMHDGRYMGGGAWGAWALLHSIFWLLLILLIAILVFVVLRGLPGRDRSKKDDGTQSSALDQLDERYARGEIDRDEYLKRKNGIMER